VPDRDACHVHILEFAFKGATLDCCRATIKGGV
jgi:hypothetical protein